MRALARFSAAAAVCAALSASAPAAAQAPATHDRAAAQALFDAGRDLMDKGQYAAACKKFEASLRSDPAAGTVLNLANCYEKAGRLASAWERFEEAQEKLAPGDDRLSVAKERAAALKARLPKLELTLDGDAPQGTQVFRDDVLVDPGALGVAIPVDPGAHRIVVKAPGHVDAEVSVDAREGKTTRQVLSIGAVGTSSSSSGAAPPAADEGGSWWTGKRVGGVVLGGAGVVGLAVGFGMGAAAISDKSTVSQDCNTTTHTCTKQAGIDAAASGKTASAVSTAAVVIGVAALAGGITLIVIGAPDKPDAKVGAMPLPGGGALSVGGAF